MSFRGLAALAIADFRERSRRPAYLVTLAAAVVLGYMALPPARSLFVIMNAGGYRGVYNSAYAGTATALAGTLWLMFGGFYVVRGAITRDEATGVGQIIAATPLKNAGYLAGKFWSNLAVLASMAGVLAVTALVLQLARGEDRGVDVGALLLPYALITLPVLAITAAAAVLMETLPVLRDGLGNIVWFFLWMAAAIAGGGVPLGGLGAVATSMRAAITAQHHPSAGEFSLGFTKLDHPLSVVTWDGLSPSGGFIVARIVVFVVAIGLAALPAVWFRRFDPARGRPRGTPATEEARAASELVPVGTAGQPAPVARASVYHPLSPSASRPWLAFWRLLVGEVRILVQGISSWWWLVIAAVNVAALAVPVSIVKPSGASTAFLLSAAWLWPILVWSRLGAQRRENGMETLLGSYPGVYRQLAAEWGAGLALTVVTGVGPLVRMAIATNGPGSAAWVAGALFIPSLALVLGTVSHTHRLFQALYVFLWYAAVNQVQAADYMGTVLVNNRPAGPPALLVAGIAVAMLALSFSVRAVRHATR